MNERILNRFSTETIGEEKATRRKNINIFVGLSSVMGSVRLGNAFATFSVSDLLLSMFVRLLQALKMIILMTNVILARAPFKLLLSTSLRYVSFFPSFTYSFLTFFLCIRNERIQLFSVFFELFFYFVFKLLLLHHLYPGTLFKQE